MIPICNYIIFLWEKNDFMYNDLYLMLYINYFCENNFILFM